MTYAARWLVAFVFTQMAESGVYAHALGDRPRAERIALALTPSAITHPLVWFVIPELVQGLGYWPYAAVAESFAVLVEAAFLRALRVPMPLLWSLLANALSYVGGMFAYTALDM